MQHLTTQFIADLRPKAAREPPKIRELLTSDPHFVAAPTSESEVWPFGEIVRGMLLDNPVTLTAMFCPIIACVSFYVARERESRQRELMRMMGLSDSMHNLSWILMFTFLNLLISFCMTISFILFFFQNSNFFIIWMILWWFCNALVTFGMLVAAIVTSERMGALGSVGLFVGLAFASAFQKDASETAKMFLCLLPPNAFVLTMKTATDLDFARAGNTFSSAYVKFGDFSVGVGTWMLFLDFWLYFGLYYYIDNIAFWRSVGVARKPWFLFTQSYWREVCGVASAIPGTNETVGVTMGSEFIESENEPHLRSMLENNRCVTVRNLCKHFFNASGHKFIAVNQLSLTMYQDECFCLLGHNGAGKTTTMMMITGCMPQSSGLIQVLGYSIPDSVQRIRTSMGFCPQHNVLIDELTVRDHLKLFGTLGGMTSDHIKRRGDDLLLAVALADKIDARSAALSGGMKRKLSCALAFLAEPYLVILDEPSSGMDPFARRGMWDTLKRWRVGHVLCLTTHYMDEADALGDRIAIMSDGELACSGVSTFLKNKFGLGYVISFAKCDDSSANDQKIVDVVRSVVGRSAEVMHSVGKELLVQVSFAAAEHFEDLFQRIDADRASLAIESYGTNITNLEEVFLKVAKMRHSSSLDGPVSENQASHADPSEIAEDDSSRPFLFFVQVLALVIRRIRFALRNPCSCCCQLGLPVMCVFLVFLITLLTTVNTIPRLVLDTSRWNPQVDGVRVPITVGTGQSDDAFAEELKEMWSTASGVDKIYFENNATASTDGLVQEGTFLQSVVKNSARTAASQYGAILYPEVSSWCPARLAPVCSATPGVTVVMNLTAPNAGAILYNIHASVAMARLTKTSSNPVAEVRVSNHPFQKTVSQRERAELVSGFVAATIIIVAYGFVPAGITGYIVMEKEKDIKNQLTISGCHQVAYLIGNYVFDICASLLTAVGAWITFAIFGIDAFTTSPGVGASVVLFIAYVLAAPPYAYAFAIPFQKSGVALFASWVFNMVFGLIGLITILIMRSFPSVADTRNTLLFFLDFLPSFALGFGHLSIGTLSLLPSYTDDLSPLSGPIVGGGMCPPGKKIKDKRNDCYHLVGDEFLCLLLSVIVFLGLVIIFDVIADMPFFRQVVTFRRVFPDVQRDNEDDMVLTEKARVADLDPKSQFIFVRDAHKLYGKNVHAVRGVSFAAAEGQVLGLLGVNGAGKTTTFKMLCGQVAATSGDVYIKGHDMAFNAARARRHIGYCPQFDALLDSLTTREHLFLYGRMKGLSGMVLESAVKSQIDDMDLSAYTHAYAGKLSGGNKRKLSVSMATIAEPSMVFLDEPSAGMDPVARRGMWSLIQNIADRRRKSVVVLTTHSMEEAEALCSRIAIQVDGVFRCLGSSQQIKTCYGQGLELNVRFASPTTSEVEKCCEKFGKTPVDIVDTRFMESEVRRISGQAVTDDLQSRLGSPLCAGSGVARSDMAVLAEWVLLIERMHAFDAFLLGILGPERSSPEDIASVPLEKTQNVVRYQIMAAVLQGRFKSLGALFSVFQRSKKDLLLEDFQLCQPSLEQIFNRFAKTQDSQATLQKSRIDSSASNAKESDVPAVTTGVPVSPQIVGNSNEVGGP
eukprot:TRINITY_DN23437_c0_g1_i1.p1 TRINITY_DN23437_c0_g1~~TRINITY_DN23437_c0_g1_i1.p1  ORF type:complete len:1655 (-),score=237.58 TRINITY_DN23437_c0_g1_i1:19-4842(-)